MKTRSGLCALFLLLGACAAPQYRSPAFKDVDVDGDGIVTWPEYQKAFPGKPRNLYLASDEDQDEQLDQSEFELGLGGSF
ncbi:MAG TPA: hypothetical protein PK636_09335 [bacterium]|nr:hypothetical protein [bacterium]HPJ72875.1 hypothetical protein [bacterium]HPQ66530.1 hypothetical protein [bacterium]